MWKPLQQHFFAVVNQHRTAFTTALLNAAADSYGCSCASFSFVSLILWLICLGVFFIDFLSCFIVLSDHSSDFSLSEDLGLFTIFTSFLFLNHLYVWSIFFLFAPNMGFHCIFLLWTIFLYLWFLDVQYNLFLVLFVCCKRLKDLCFVWDVLLWTFVDAILGFFDGMV